MFLSDDLKVNVTHTASTTMSCTLCFFEVNPQNGSLISLLCLKFKISKVPRAITVNSTSQFQKVLKMLESEYCQRFPCACLSVGARARLCVMCAPVCVVVGEKGTHTGRGEHERERSSSLSLCVCVC